MRNTLIAITLLLFIGVFVCALFLSDGKQFFLTGFTTVCFLASTGLLFTYLITGGFKHDY